MAKQVYQPAIKLYDYQRDMIHDIILKDQVEAGEIDILTYVSEINIPPNFTTTPILYKFEVILRGQKTGVTKTIIVNPHPPGDDYDHVFVVTPDGGSFTLIDGKLSYTLMCYIHPKYNTEGDATVTVEGDTIYIDGNEYININGDTITINGKEFHGIPAGGDAGFFLAKNSAGDYDVHYIKGNIGAVTDGSGGTTIIVDGKELHGVPAGGDAGFFLAKNSAGDYDVHYIKGNIGAITDGSGGTTIIVDGKELHGVPAGGVTGAVLAKKTNTNNDVEWTLNATQLNAKSQVVNSLVGNQTTLAPSVSAVNSGITTKVDDLATTVASNLSNKVDKIAGKGLSTNDFSTAEKTKLAGLESSHFKGEFVNLAALNNVTGVAGDYAYVDLGTGQDVTTYIWDTTDNKWIDQKGLTTAETAASVKTKYESNTNTNAFTDAEKAKLAKVSIDELNDGKGLSANDFTNAEKAKLAGIQAGAEVNQYAYSNVKVGTTTIAASAKTDTINFTENTGISLTSNAATKTVTIAGKDATTSAKGIIKLATDAEMDAGASTTIVPTVKQVADKLSNKVDKVAGKGLSTNDFSTAEKTKLAGIEAGATAETAATIKTKYESNSNTNAFTDALLTKLNGIATGATNTAEETAATIKTKYESNSNTNAFTDAEKTKLSGIEAGAQVNQDAFTKVKVGSVTITATSATDQFEVIIGEGITGIVDEIAKTITLYGNKALEAVKVGGTTITW
jgi:energy-converting hydrogenase Eha subunit B